ncbi:MAG: hypothetical protein ACU0CO_15195 [Shimia sp.]
MRLMMLACCAVMAVPLVGWVAAGGLALGAGSGLAAALPILACLALHGVMFLVLGRSCHGAAKDERDNEPASLPEAARVPAVVRPAARPVEEPT